MFDDSQKSELKKINPNFVEYKEAGLVYFLIPAYKLPEGCTPQVVDLLLCPLPRDGYNSRLFFSEKIDTSKKLNWNSTTRIIERNWFAFSLKIADGMRLVQILASHLKGLKE